MISGDALGDLIELQRGTTYKSGLLGQPGPVLLGLATIARNGGFRADSLKTYGGDSPARITLAPGEVYVSLKDVTQAGDLLGSVSRVPSWVSAGRLTQDTVKLIPRQRTVDMRHVYWTLRTPQYRRYCRERGMGTTNLSLSRADFLAFLVPPPDIMRTTLVDLLEALDDKIELNRRMNETVEGLIRALYDQRPHNGSKAVRLDEVAELIRETVDPATLDRGETYVAMDHLRSGALVADRFESAESVISHKSRFLEGDILVGKLRPNFRKAGIVDRSGVCSTEILVLRPNAGHVLTVLGTVGAPEFFARLTSHSDGTRMPRARADDVLSAPVLLPADGALDEQAALSLLRLAANNNRESEMLATLRDALLPELVSGRLRVKDAQAAIGAAV